MKPVKFEENELMVMAIFAEKTRQDTVEALKETLDVLEESKEDVSFLHRIHPLWMFWKNQKRMYPMKK